MVAPYGAISSELCQRREFNELADRRSESATHNNTIFTKARSSLSFSQEVDLTWNVQDTEVRRGGRGLLCGGIYQRISQTLWWSGLKKQRCHCLMLVSPPLSKFRGHENDNLKTP